MANSIIGADSRFDSDTIVAPTAATGFPESALSDDRIFTLYKPASAATSVAILTDKVTSNVTVDYFMMVGHNLGTIGSILTKFQLSDDNFSTGSITGVTDVGGGQVLILSTAHGLGNGSRITISGTTSYNGEFTVSAVDVNDFEITATFVASETGTWDAFFQLFSVTPTDDKIIARSFTSVAARFYRVIMTGSSFTPSIGQLQWGEAVSFPFSLQRGFDAQDERVMARSSRSQTGNILGAVTTFSTRRARLRFTLMPSSFTRGSSTGDFQDFWDNHASLMKPFLWHWNPGNPGSFEKDAFFAIIDPGGGISRPLSTPVDSGFQDIQFSVQGVKEV